MQVIAVQRSLQKAIVALARYLTRNVKEAYSYLAPHIVRRAKDYYHALASWLEKVFASPSIKQFDRDSSVKEPPQTESRVESKVEAQVESSPTAQLHQSYKPTTQPHSQVNTLDSSQECKQAHREEPEFDEKEVVVLYHNEERENRAKEQDEARYKTMVRLVDREQADKNTEVLRIDVGQAISRAKAYEQEVPLQEAPAYHTKIIDSQRLSQLDEVASPPIINPSAIDSPAIDRIALDSSAMAHIEPSLESSPPESSQINPSTQASPLESSSSAKDINESAGEQVSLPELEPTSPLEPSLDSSSALSQKTQPTIARSLESSAQHLESLERGELVRPKDYTLPPTTLLQPAQDKKISFEEGEIDQKIQNLLTKLKVFKIDGDVVRIYSGPVVTTFEFRPAPNVKVSRIQSLSDDLAMALSARSIRIQAPIPEKDVVGIEVPNSQKEMIYLREILESEVFKSSSSPLVLGLGKDIVGNPFVTDLQKLPHLLIAGTTGSGKSVGLNAMILSLLYRNSPDNLRLIMVDPKKVEFSLYEEIPHLLTPIITDAKKAIIALNNVAREMERRYEMMKAIKTKTIDGYNAKARSEGGEILPFIVIIIDELADLMMTGGKEAEGSIIRIAQMGRAAGLHLIVATQRPSVDVVTGLIKTNLPAKIAYKVGSRMDSRVILDAEGAQNLLGQGDMLFSLGGGGGVLRLHAPWASEDEIESIVDFIREQREVQYDSSFLADSNALRAESESDNGDEGDLLAEAKRAMKLDGKTSISNLQRRLGIGYNKAAVLVEELEKQGFLSAPNAKGTREIIG
ncbi:DNA translocase FtsK [Helicobacter canis]|uniref:DNA translocase FtsK n=2 Tax=Helicobacter canis TaxID=29419 RepID=A0A5M9QFD8_9HELI|nr:DNA translocase FtsK [Helicobacter canis]